MSKIFTVLFLCISVVACGAKTQQVYKPSERITVLVSYFERNSNREDLEQYRVGLTDMFITELQAMPQLQVVERSRLDTIMDELELAELGVIDPETAQKIGRIVGAQAFYKGSFTTTPSGKVMRLDGQLIRLETYEVEAAAEDTCEVSDKQIFRMVKRQSKIIGKQIKAIHGELVADSFYSKGRTAEEENDRSGAIRYYQQALGYHKDHELSQKALNRLQPM